MAAGPNTSDLHAAWRALSGEQRSDGWATIPVASPAPCLVCAGRRWPGNEEAVLFGFRTLGSLSQGRLPQGQGFETVRLDSDPIDSGRSWIAVAKRPGASVELFGMMAEDVLGLLGGGGAPADDNAIVGRLVARISAWQDFMERHRDGVLSLEAEIGLFGELTVLERSLDLGAEPRVMIDAWQGPLGGVQDFIPGTGAIEVKATLAARGFPASIPSLEQLDDSIRQPLYLAAMKFTIDPTGATLPEKAKAVRGKIEGHGGALDSFDVRLLQAGLVPAALHRYTRRFLCKSTAILAVAANFPRLTRGHVHPAIGRARYEIDLDLADAADVGLDHALRTLGAT